MTSHGLNLDFDHNFPAGQHYTCDPTTDPSKSNYRLQAMWSPISSCALGHVLLELNPHCLFPNNCSHVDSVCRAVLVLIVRLRADYFCETTTCNLTNIRERYSVWRFGCPLTGMNSSA